MLITLYIKKYALSEKYITLLIIILKTYRYSILSYEIIKSRNYIYLLIS